MRTLASELSKNIGKKVTLSGWIHKIRKLGGITFIVLRDRTGFAQAVVEKADAVKLLEGLSTESVVSLSGKVAKEERAPGGAELRVDSAEILNKSKVPPFMTYDTRNINEEARLTYRYLDLRSKRMSENIRFRHKVIKYIRDFLDAKDFIEIETPILTKSTPEGARDYLVPARLQRGKFFALPQAPQQFKQLSMVAGFEKYFQIARCFRDEDTRGDRQPEFTQLDLEMSFTDQEEILQLIETLYIEIVEKLTDKKLTFKPFKRLTYKEAVEKYKTDSPDLRKNKKDPTELAFVWIVDWPLFEYNKEEKRYDPHHHIFTSPKESDLGKLEKNPLAVHSWQHDLVLNGEEIGGGSIRIHKPEIQEKILELVGISKKESKEKFGHMLTAFEYGAPPHGGIAMGLDRLIMILRNESSIREVIAFPKSQEAKDLTMNAPSEIDSKQLKELGIEVLKSKKKA